jgi:hypothetical protein
MCSGVDVGFLPQSSALKMEVVRPPGKLVYTYKSIRHSNPEYQHRHLHRRENLTSHEYKGVSWKPLTGGYNNQPIIS